MRRYVIYGAGAIGGVIGVQLMKAGANVTFIARGLNYEAMKTRGLRVRTPESDETFTVNVVNHPGALGLNDEDVVILAMKTQDTADAVSELRQVTTLRTIVICAQNGVENERVALRHFDRVLGAFALIAGVHLYPGEVDVYTWPCLGVFDIGGFPRENDALADELAAQFSAAGFDARPRHDIMAWKRQKMSINLANVIQAITGATISEIEDLADAARREAAACFEAAGLATIDMAVVHERIARVMTLRPIDGQPFPGTSSWQSLQRGARVSEVDYLNGEIVLLGRQHGIPVPVNILLNRKIHHMAAHGMTAGSIPLQALTDEIESMLATHRQN